MGETRLFSVSNFCVSILSYLTSAYRLVESSNYKSPLLFVGIKYLDAQESRVRVRAFPALGLKRHHRAINLTMYSALLFSCLFPQGFEFYNSLIAEHLYYILLGSLFKRGDWRNWRDISRIEAIIRDGIGHKELDLSMYPRILIVADVIKATLREEEAGTLTDVMISGVINSLDCLINRLEEMKQSKDPGFISYWRNYTQELIRNIRLCGILPKIKQFREVSFSVTAKTNEQLLEKNAKAKVLNYRFKSSKTPGNYGILAI